MLFEVGLFRGLSCREHSTSEHSTSEHGTNLSEGHFLCCASCDLCFFSMVTVLVEEAMAEETVGEKKNYYFKRSRNPPPYWPTLSLACLFLAGLLVQYQCLYWSSTSVYIGPVQMSILVQYQCSY